MTVAHSALKASLIAVNYTYLILLLLQHFLLLAVLLMLIIVMEDFILKHSLGESLFYGCFPEQIDLLFSQGLCQGFLQMTSKGKNKHISFPLVVCFWVETLKMWVSFSEHCISEFAAISSSLLSLLDRPGRLPGAPSAAAA